jgi:hypothetical protein
MSSPITEIIACKATGFQYTVRRSNGKEESLSGGEMRRAMAEDDAGLLAIARMEFHRTDPRCTMPKDVADNLDKDMVDNVDHELYDAAAEVSPPATPGVQPAAQPEAAPDSAAETTAGRLARLIGMQVLSPPPSCASPDVSSTATVTPQRTTNQTSSASFSSPAGDKTTSISRWGNNTQAQETMVDDEGSEPTTQQLLPRDTYQRGLPATALEALKPKHLRSRAGRARRRRGSRE